MSRRTPFRPDALGPLEDRVVPSPLSPAHVAPATRVVVYGPQVHPTFVTQNVGSNKLRVHHHSHRHGLRYQTRESAPSVQEVAAGADPNTYTFKISYKNRTNIPVASASIVDFLHPKLDYVAGSEQSTAGARFSETVTRRGVEVLRWFLPGGIDAAATGSVSFRAKLK